MLSRLYIHLGKPYPKNDTVSYVWLLIGSNYLKNFVKSYESQHYMNLMKINVGHILWGPLAVTRCPLPHVI